MGRLAEKFLTNYFYKFFCRYNFINKIFKMTDGNVITRFIDSLAYFVDAPVTWFRESVVEPNRADYHWYHRKFQRVPTIDQCYEDDYVCYLEANSQFKRDRLVDSEIINILRQRMEDCVMYEGHNQMEACKEVRDNYDAASENYFAKYGDLGARFDVREAFMKQKHRMIWERRHGKIGTGIKEAI